MRKKTEIFSVGGSELEVTLREFVPEDALEVVECIRDEYGKTYLKQEFYDPAYLIHEVASGHIKFLVALAKGELIAVLGLKFAPPRETMCEWITGVVLKKYRSLGLMNRLFHLAEEEMALIPGISSGYGFSVTYHDISQRAMGRLGFVPTGFLPSVLSIGSINHSFMRDGNLKHHHVIIVKPLEKLDVGEIFVPKEHEAFVQKIYTNLGVRHKTKTKETPLSGKTMWEADVDKGQKSVTIWIDRSGADLLAVVDGIERKYQDPLSTFNLFLNISDENAIAAYYKLRGRGYFLAGLRPLSTKNEIMVLHNPKKVPIDFASLCLTRAAREIADYVDACYREGLLT